MSEEQTSTTGPTNWKPLFIIPLLGLLADQASKFWAVKALTNLMVDVPGGLGTHLKLWWNEGHLSRMARSPFEVPAVIDSFWSWRYAENPGAAWSFAAGWPEGVRMVFFPSVALLALVMITLYYRRLRPEQHLLRWALPFVMAGALGNLTDRLIRGYVIDFIDWHLNDHFWQRPNVHWPTFNVADVCISIGVGLIALDSLLSTLAERRKAREEPAAPSSAN